MTTGRQAPDASRDGRPAEARVLGVDDEPAITERIGIALRYEGFAVETAGSGATFWFELPTGGDAEFAASSQLDHRETTAAPGEV